MRVLLILFFFVLSGGNLEARNTADELLLEMKQETAFEIGYQGASMLCSLRCSNQSKKDCAHSCRVEEGLKLAKLQERQPASQPLLCLDLCSRLDLERTPQKSCAVLCRATPN